MPVSESSVVGRLKGQVRDDLPAKRARVTRIATAIYRLNLERVGAMGEVGEGIARGARVERVATISAAPERDPGRGVISPRECGTGRRRLSVRRRRGNRRHRRRRRMTGTMAVGAVDGEVGDGRARIAVVDPYAVQRCRLTGLTTQVGAARAVADDDVLLR